MKVTVYQGKNFVLTNEHVLRQAATQPDLTPVWVLVPDRFTLQAERMMLGCHGNLLNTRVITFSMLYQLVSTELNHGQPANQVLDKTSAVLTLWTAIRQVQDQLLWFKKSVAHYDFAERMFNTLNQIRSSRVNLSDLTNQATTAVAKKKYHDINLIDGAYQKMLAGRTDSAGMLDYLIEHLTESTTVKQTAIYVCGFESLSPARLAVLDVLCQLAAKVTIATATAELSQQLSKYPHYQIAAPAFTAQSKTMRCFTERNEAERVAEQVVQLLNQGVPAESIVILLTEFETLAPVWQVVFNEHQIPINLDVGKKLSTTPDAKLIRDVMEMNLNDHAENTLAVLFNQGNQIADDDLFAWENQILQRNLRGGSVDAVPKIRRTTDLAQYCTQLKTLTTQPKLHDLLDQIMAYQDLNTLTERDLINLYWSLCSATKISNIPQYVDRVLIAPVTDWVPSQVRVLIIANRTEENFPQGQSDDDLLQETDLINTQITPTPSLQRLRNHRHAELLSTVATDWQIDSGTCEDYTAVAYQPTAGFNLPETQSDIQCGRALFFPANQVRTTLVEQYYSCPYLNFIQNGLRLSPRDIYQLKPNNIGSAIHKALEIYFTRHDVEQAITEGLKLLAYDSLPIVVNLTKEIRFIIEQLEMAFRGGQFQIHALEQKISRPLADGLTLVGRVDRVDWAPVSNGQHAILVIDYKTGNAPGGIPKSIYLGNKLQLPVYAAALSQNGPIAGAGYLSLASGYVDDDSKDLQLKGFVAKDYRDLFPPQIINPDARYYVEPDEMANLCRHANRLVDEAVNKIMGGDVQARAVDKKICEYCPVKALCRQAKQNCRGEKMRISYKKFSGGQPC